MHRVPAQLSPLLSVQLTKEAPLKSTNTTNQDHDFLYLEELTQALNTARLKYFQPFNKVRIEYYRTMSTPMSSHTPSVSASTASLSLYWDSFEYFTNTAVSLLNALIPNFIAPDLLPPARKKAAAKATRASKNIIRWLIKSGFSTKLHWVITKRSPPGNKLKHTVTCASKWQRKSASTAVLSHSSLFLHDIASMNLTFSKDSPTPLH